ncbi:HamA C-terminal domain-containing protein, partial [Salmonella enterica]
YQRDTGSTLKITKLFMQAMGLFTSLSNSGEGGELILFLFAEKFLKLPQIICKMNLKTNPEMHYHGADGVHIGVDNQSQKLCLYWGESKLYSDLTQAIYKCMKSISPL